MAFIDNDNKDATDASFYNVTAAVGFGCPNMVEDVKVIQFFLQRIFTLPGCVRHKPPGTMTVDGKVGPITRTWITKGQMVARLSHANVLVDGKVDKAGNPGNASNETTSISHTMYTIRAFNNALRHGDKAVFKTLTTNPVVPPDVRMIFQQIHAQGPAFNYGIEN